MLTEDAACARARELSVTFSPVVSGTSTLSGRTEIMFPDCISERPVIIDPGDQTRESDYCGSAVRHPTPAIPEVLELRPGERRGWWSSHAFDRRIRMRAVIAGAVNNFRTSILLDTGSNVSVVTRSPARKLRLHIRQNDHAISIQGISGTSIRAREKTTVKITLGWYTTYIFEV